MKHQSSTSANESSSATQSQAPPNSKETDKNVHHDIMDNILYHVGEMGRYQKLLFVGMMPFGVTFAYVYFVQMFIAATPQKYWCKVPELQHLDLEQRRNLSTPVVNGKWDRCLTYKTDWTVVLDTKQPPKAGTPTVPCHNGWEFKLGDIPYHTVVSERGWVCQHAKYVPLSQSIYFGGSIVGGLFFGWLADTFGRVPALVGTNMMGFAGSIATIFTTGVWDFVFCRFLVGMAYDNCFIMMYILVLEYVGPRQRTCVANMSIALFYGPGCMSLPWLAIWIADWRKLILYTALPKLLVLLTPFLVPESARWLSSRGSINEAVNVLKRFERINGTKIPLDLLDKFIASSRQSTGNTESLVSMVKRPLLRDVMIFMVVVFMSVAVVYDGIVRMSENLGYDFFITFTLTSATEIPSAIMLTIVLDRWGRRALCCVPLSSAGILCLIAIFCPKGITQVTLAVMARFAINLSYNSTIQWSTEVLPTPVRALGTSVIRVSGYLSTVMSPYIIYSERLWNSLPLLILGLTAIIASFFSVLLPETKGQPMPQTMEDGEQLVREFTLYSGGKKDKDKAAGGTDKTLIIT